MEKKIKLSLNVVKQLRKEILQSGHAHSMPENGDKKSLANCFYQVDAELTIYLPCLSGKEKVNLSPLPKTVLFLFLIHPEGIILRSFSNYKDELTAIYHSLIQMEKSVKTEWKSEKVIDNLACITSNRFYENSSIIKRYLIQVVGEESAIPFYITKQANGIHSIQAKLEAKEIEMLKTRFGIFP